MNNILFRLGVASLAVTGLACVGIATMAVLIKSEKITDVVEQNITISSQDNTLKAILFPVSVNLKLQEQIQKAEAKKGADSLIINDRYPLVSASIGKNKTTDNFGTAFSVGTHNGKNIWFTVLHNSLGCGKLNLYSHDGKAHEAVFLSGRAPYDIGIVESDFSAPAMSLMSGQENPKLAERAIVAGFVGADIPQALSVEMIGTLVISRPSEGQTLENGYVVLKESQKGLVSEDPHSLGGMSGGPIFGEDGRVQGILSSAKNGLISVTSPAFIEIANTLGIKIDHKPIGHDSFKILTNALKQDSLVRIGCSPAVKTEIQ